jgi:transposase
MKDKNHIEERIIELLREHPEGLPILEIAKLIGMHRHTIAKYIYYLARTGTIYQREVAAAKLCYLSSTSVKSAKEKEVFEKIEKGLEK